MKIPEALTNTFSSLFASKKPAKDLFLSLLLGPERIEAAAWYVNTAKTTLIEKITFENVLHDTWEDRIQAADNAIGTLEETVGVNVLHKVIFGLPSPYLTDMGDIQKAIKPDLKRLSEMLDLTAVGFVSMPQALIYKLKIDEGVPPTVILLGVFDGHITVTLYKIGLLSGQRTLVVTGDVVAAIESALKSFTDIEVLPSRMMLYGVSPERLVQIQSALLKHPWQTKANFMHFPKIEIFPADFAISAICLAGSSELAASISEEVVIEPEPVSEGDETRTVMVNASGEPVKKEPVVAETGVDVVTVTADETPLAMTDIDIAEEEAPQGEEVVMPEESNVVEVAPETLGFSSRLTPRVPQAPTVDTQPVEVDEDENEDDDSNQQTGLKLPKISLPSFIGNPVMFGSVGLVTVILLGCWIWYWFVPRATVTAYQLPQTVSKTGVVIIDPQAESISAENKIVPGRKQEKSVSGDKAVPATGKKKIGDPARGKVTIYNKALTARSFKKGSVMLSGALQFTLDDEVNLEAATKTGTLLAETITFSSAKVAVTASAIGTAGNLPSGTEFTFKDAAASSAVARSDAAFAGGSSRDVTVVSRADVDELTKDLTTDLVEKAKQDLNSAVAGDERLVESTIKTSVTEKVFAQEVNQEAASLQGKLTITVSGLSYSQRDVTTLLSQMAGENVPPGYKLDESHTTLSAGDAVLKKDGTLTLPVTMNTMALPIWDTKSLQKSLAGKSVKDAEGQLRSMTGIGAAEFAIKLSPWKDRLPANSANITIRVQIQQ